MSNITQVVSDKARIPAQQFNFVACVLTLNGTALPQLITTAADFSGIDF